MQWTYGALFLLSLSLLPLYFLFVRKKQNEPWLLFLFACVAVSTSDEVYRKTVCGKLPFVEILEKIKLNFNTENTAAAVSV